MSNEQTFAQWIKNTRKEFNMSAKKLGEQLGCSQTYISKIENGDRKFPEDKLEALAGVFDLEPDSVRYVYKAGPKEMVYKFTEDGVITVDATFEKIVFKRQGKPPHVLDLDFKQMVELQEYFL